jgi:hypothetical protein
LLSNDERATQRERINDNHNALTQFLYISPRHHQSSKGKKTKSKKKTYKQASQVTIVMQAENRKVQGRAQLAKDGNLNTNSGKTPKTRCGPRPPIPPPLRAPAGQARDPQKDKRASLGSGYDGPETKYQADVAESPVPNDKERTRSRIVSSDTVKQKRPKHFVANKPKAFRDKIQEAKETILEKLERRGRRLPSSIFEDPSIEIEDWRV